MVMVMVMGDSIVFSAEEKRERVVSFRVVSCRLRGCGGHGRTVQDRTCMLISTRWRFFYWSIKLYGNTVQGACHAMPNWSCPSVREGGNKEVKPTPKLQPKCTR